MTNQEINLQKQVDYFANLARSQALTDILKELLSRMKMSYRKKADYQLEMEAIREFSNANEFAVQTITSDMKYILNDSWIKLRSHTIGDRLQVQVLYKITFKDGSVRWTTTLKDANTYPDLVQALSTIIDIIEETQKEAAKISLVK